MDMARNWRHVETRTKSTNIHHWNRKGLQMHDKNEMETREESEYDGALDCVFGKIHFHMLPAQGFTETFLV